MPGLGKWIVGTCESVDENRRQKNTESISNGDQTGCWQMGIVQVVRKKSSRYDSWTDPVTKDQNRGQGYPFRRPDRGNLRVQESEVKTNLSSAYISPRNDNVFKENK